MTEALDAPRPLRASRSPAWRRLADAWPWLPIVLAAAYVVVLLAQFPEVVRATYMNADAASAPVIGQLLGHGYGQVLLGYLPWYSTLIYELSTRWIPDHRALWEITPYGLAVVSAGLVGFAVRRVADRWAAGIAVALLLCASPATLQLLFSLNDHSPTWFSLALLGAFAVALHTSFVRQRVGLAAAVAVVLGLIVGINAASDSLLIVGGIAPLVLAAAGAWGMHRTRQAVRALWLCGLCATIAVLAAVITSAVMRGQNIHYVNTLTFAQAGQISHNVTLWLQSMAVLGNGNFFGRSVGFLAVLYALCAALTIGALVALPWWAWREVRRRASPSALGEAVADGGAARATHVLFWTLAGLGLTGAFVLSSSPQDVTSDRYLVGVLYAGCALVPLLARGPLGRAAVTAAAAVFCTVGLIGMAQGTATVSTSPNAPDQHVALQIARVARQLGLSHGYAGYWDAAPITWESNYAVHVYPVDSCLNDLCQFPIHNIQSWYVPERNTQSFVITDPNQPFLPTLPINLPKAQATYHFGALTMYVYDYDLATGVLH